MANRSKVLLKLGITVGLLSLIFGVCEIAASDTSPPKKQSQSQTDSRAKDLPEIDYNITDRGGNRTVAFYHITDGFGQLTITVDNEIDITSITFSNGLFMSGVGDEGGMIITESSGEDLLLVATEGFGVQHLTFPTPLMLREDDEVRLFPSSVNLSEWDITLHGRIPTPTGFKLK